MRNASSRCFSRPGKNAGTILDASAIPKRRRSLKRRLKLLAACAKPWVTISRAVKRSGGPRVYEERNMGEHSSPLLVSILLNTPLCSSERKAVRLPLSAVREQRGLQDNIPGQRMVDKYRSSQMAESQL